MASEANTVLEAPVPATNSVVGELKTLIRQSSHYLVGLVGGLALGFISFPIFTRMFSVADYGLIDFAQKIIVLTVAFAKGGLQNSALRFFNREKFKTDRDEARRYYSTMFYGVAAFAAPVTVLFLAGNALLPENTIDAPLRAILAFGGILIFVRAMQSMVWSFARIEERTKAYTISNLLVKAGAIAAIFALIPLLGTSVRTYYAGTMVAEIAILAAMSFGLFRGGLLRFGFFSRELCGAALAFGLPMVAQELAGIILDSGSRALIRYYLGADPLGYYSVAYGLAGYVNTLLMAPLGLAILPIYMRLWREEGREKTIEFLSMGLNAFLLCATGLLALAAVCSNDAVVLMASRKFSQAGPLIPTLVAGLLIYTIQVFLNAGLLIQKKTGTMAMVLGLSAVLNLGLNVILLPRMGLQGAAIAALLSFLISTVLMAHLAFKILPMKVRWLPLAGYIGATAVVYFVVPLIHMSRPLLNLAVKAPTALVLFGGIVYAIDPEVRRLVAMVLRRLNLVKA